MPARRWFLIAVLVTAAPGCFEEDCVDQEICSSDGCVCGAGCTSGLQCAAGELCAARTYDPVGVCVSQEWCTAHGCVAADDPCVACTSSQTCVLFDDGSKSCADFCTDASQCTTECCRELQTGQSACVDATYCGAPPDGCTDTSACVTLTNLERGTHCGDPTSVELDVGNACVYAIDVEVCFEKENGTQDCMRHSDLGPGEVDGAGFWTCDATGQYVVGASLATDPSCCAGFDEGGSLGEGAGCE